MMAVMLLCCQILTEWGAGQGTGWEGEEGGVEVGGGGGAVFADGGQGGDAPLH